MRPPSALFTPVASKDARLAAKTSRSPGAGLDRRRARARRRRHSPRRGNTRAAMASAAFDYLIFPLLLPLLLAWMLAARLLSLLAPLTLLPTWLLARRLYWAVPVVPHIWRQGGWCGRALRLGFEYTYCANTVRRLLTLPLRRATPKLFIAGFPLAGGAQLAAYLRQHPALSSIEGVPWHPALATESHFFGGVLGRGSGASPALYRSFFPTVLTRWLRERVRRAGRWTVFDACPLACLPHAPRRIAALAPAARLVFCVRDPVEAAFAAELTLRNLNYPLEWSMMEDIVAADPRFAESADDLAFWRRLEGLGADEPLPEELPRRVYARCAGMLRLAAYADRVAPFLELFPRESIMFVEYAELAVNPEAVVAEVLRFAGADPELRGYKLARLPPPARDDGADRRGRRVHPAVRRKLEAHFAGPNRRLFALAGREFPWGETAAEDEEEGGALAAAPAPPLAAIRRLDSGAAQLLPGAAAPLERKDSRLVRRVLSIRASASGAGGG